MIKPTNGKAPAATGALQENTMTDTGIIAPASLLGNSLPIQYTVFRDLKAKASELEMSSWAELIEAIRSPRLYPSKPDCPLLKLATFGDMRSEAGSLRTDDNMLQLWGVEGDYDDELVSLDQAADRLAVHGIEALFYTSASHTPAAPRWRVLVPLSTPHDPAEHRRLVAMVNWALGGVLGGESFTASQSYYFGKVKGAPYQVRHVRGQLLDTLDLSLGETYPQSKAPSNNDPASSDLDRAIALHEVTEETVEEVRSALMAIDMEHVTDRKRWANVGMALKSLAQAGHPDAAHAMWHEFSQRDPEKYDATPGRVDYEWDTFKPNKITYKTIFTLAQADGWVNPKKGQPVAAAPHPGRDPVALDWHNIPENPPDPHFVIPGWMPDGVVTLFAAHGGTGKSFMSVYIALCLATGRHPFNIQEEIPRVKVVLYSAEDNMQVMQSRFARYMRILGITGHDLDGWLLVLDATEADNVLFTGDEKVDGRTTARFNWLADQVQGFGADVLIFDNASDAMDANENDRAKVRQFMSCLKRLASAVLLLAHVDAMSSMADHDDAKGYSGSTGWHNSARSRWFMSRSRDSEDVTLTLPKVNYAKAGGMVTIRWSDMNGVFEVIGLQSGSASAASNRLVLMRLAHKVIENMGSNVSPSSNAATSLWNTIKGMEGFPRGLKSKNVAQELMFWRTQGWVAVADYTRTNRATGQRLVFTPAGVEVLEGLSDA